MSRTERFDLVVVGGGTAGCVVAARASEDRARRVLLIEEGPDPRPVPRVVADPGRQTELVERTGYVRRYPVARPDGSAFALLSGRIIGGGSSVNNLAVLRPPRRDFDIWSGYGGEAWSYEALLPVMRALEDDPDFPDHPLHGRGGPLLLQRPFRLDGPADPPARALVDAALALGLPACPDLHVPEPFGVCSSPYNVRDGRRVSTATAWLDPARGRANLTVLPDTAVTRVIVDGTRARGVEVAAADGRRTIAADEIVLAAGVFHSPQLLMLSGIGPVAELERVGVSVVHPLAGVGANYRDHAVVFVRFAAGRELRADHVIPKVRAIARSGCATDLPDLHLMFRSPVGARGDPLLPVSVHLLDHRSAGRVTIASADPVQLPRVDAALLEHPDDRRALADGVRLATRIAGHRAAAPFYGALVEPAPGDAIEAWVLRTFGTYHHGVGTCRIGPAGDPGAVVDRRLRVHGLDGLRVADASVLPTIPRANTNLAAILVGEIAAREIARA